MTPHYDLKQLKKKKKKNWCFGGWAGRGWESGVINIFVIYLAGGGGGVEYFFPTGLGGGRGSSKFLPTT